MVSYCGRRRYTWWRRNEFVGPNVIATTLGACVAIDVICYPSVYAGVNRRRTRTDVVISCCLMTTWDRRKVVVPNAPRRTEYRVEDSVVSAVIGSPQPPMVCADTAGF